MLMTYLWLKVPNFEIQALVQQLNTRFALKDLGEVDYFLGIQVKHTIDGLHLSQTKYVTNLLCKTKMQLLKSCPHLCLDEKNCLALEVIQ